MTPTKQDCEKLARTFAECYDGDQDNWEDYCLTEPVTTRETLEDFSVSAKSWPLAQGRKEGEGYIFWEKMQASKGDERKSFAVVDCGEFRICYSQ